MSAEPTTENKELAEVLAPFVSQPTTPLMFAVMDMLLGKIAGLAAKVDALTQALDAQGDSAGAPQGERSLTAKELCSRMKISESTLRNWRKNPDFPAVEQKGRGKRPIRRYKLAEVQDWNEKQRGIARELEK